MVFCLHTYYPHISSLIAADGQRGDVDRSYGRVSTLSIRLHCHFRIGGVPLLYGHGQRSDVADVRAKGLRVDIQGPVAGGGVAWRGREVGRRDSV